MNRGEQGGASRWLLPIVGVAAAVMLTALAALLRRSTRTFKPQPESAAVIPQTLNATAPSSPPQPAQQAALFAPIPRWLILTVLLLSAVPLMLFFKLLPSDTSMALIFALLLASIIIGSTIKLLNQPALAHFTFASQLLTAAAGGMLLLGTLLLRDYENPMALLAAVYVLITAFLTAGAAARYSTWTLTLPNPVKQGETGVLNRRMLLAALVLLAVLAAVNLSPLPAISQHVQFALFCAVLVLLVLALGTTKALNPKDAAVAPTKSLANIRFPTSGFSAALKSKTAAGVTENAPTGYDLSLWLKQYGALVGIVILAFALRTWQLHSTVRTPVDELAFMASVNAFATADDIRLIAPMGGVFPFSKIFSYLQSNLVFATERTWFGFRLIGAITNTLNIIALYGLARTLFDKPTAIIAGVLFAALPPAMHFGRLGLNNIADPLFGTAALWFLARGLIHGKRLDYALGGVMLALTQYFHEGGRLLFPLLTTAWLTGALVLWGVWKHWRGLRAMAVIALLTATPFYLAYFTSGYGLTSRVGAWGFNADYLQQIFTLPHLFLQHLQEKTIPAFTVYVGRPDSSLYFGGLEPLLLVYVAPFFLFGLALAVWRWRQPAMQLFVLWILAASLGNGLLVGADVSLRYLPVLPAIALLTALGLRCFVHLLLPQAHQTRCMLMALVLIVLVIGQVNYYFRDHLPILELQTHYAEPLRGALDGIDAMERAASFPTGTRIYLLGSPPFHAGMAADALYFFTGPESQMLVFSQNVSIRPLDDEFFHLLARNVDTAFFVEPRDWVTIERLHSQYPTLEGPFNSPFPMLPGTAYVLYFLPKEG